MTTRRNFLKQSLLAAGAASVPTGSLLAQEKAEEKRPKYNLPYKNTYLKEPFVTENEFRTARPETITPGTFEEAKQILPNPTWSGHEKEIEMYWKAWRQHQGPGTGFRFRMQLPRCRLQRQYLHVGLRLHDDVRPFRYPLLPLPTYVR